MRVAFLLFGLVVALGLAEIALRIFGHEGPVYTIRDPVIGRRYTRSWEGDCWIEEAERVIHLRFNREGMRDRDWPEERAPNTVRIAILGDSMVAALGVPEEKTFVRLLQARLQAQEAEHAKEHGRTARTYEVMNWGVQGSSPALQFVLYEERVRRYAPDVVVGMFFTGNDFSDDWQPIGGRRQGWGSRKPDGSLEHEPFGGSDFSFNEWLARNSRLYVWQKRVLSRLRDDGLASPRPGLRAFDDSADFQLGAAWEFAFQVQQGFEERARWGRHRYELVLLPCADEVYDDLWSRAVAEGRARGWNLVRDNPAATLGAKFDEDGLTQSLGPTLVGPRRTPAPRDAVVLQWNWLATAMRKLVAGRPSGNPNAQLYLRGSGHLNERGHELVAQTLAAHDDERFLR